MTRFEQASLSTSQPENNDNHHALNEVLDFVAKNDTALAMTVLGVTAISAGAMLRGEWMPGLADFMSEGKAALAAEQVEANEPAACMLLSDESAAEGGGSRLIKALVRGLRHFSDQSDQVSRALYGGPAIADTSKAMKVDNFLYGGPGSDIRVGGARGMMELSSNGAKAATGSTTETGIKLSANWVPIDSKPWGYS